MDCNTRVLPHLVPLALTVTPLSPLRFCIRYSHQPDSYRAGKQCITEPTGLPMADIKYALQNNPNDLSVKAGHRDILIFHNVI